MGILLSLSLRKQSFRDLKALNVPEVGGWARVHLQPRAGKQWPKKKMSETVWKKRVRAIERGKRGGEAGTLDDCEKLKDAKTTFSFLNYLV